MFHPSDLNVDLSEEEFRLLDRFLGRINDLTPEVQVRITTDLVRRFESRIPRQSTDLQGYLVTVFAEEQRKRRSRDVHRPGVRIPGAAVDPRHLAGAYQQGEQAGAKADLPFEVRAFALVPPDRAILPQATPID